MREKVVFNTAETLQVSVCAESPPRDGSGGADTSVNIQKAVAFKLVADNRAVQLAGL